MERVVIFLKDTETYYLATVEGDQPRVRPFGTAHIFEGKICAFSSFTHELEVGTQKANGKR